MPEQPSYRNLFVRVSGALAMTEAAFLEAGRVERAGAPEGPGSGRSLSGQARPPKF